MEINKKASKQPKPFKTKTNISNPKAETFCQPSKARRPRYQLAKPTNLSTVNPSTVF
jgi:hypothetical protein